MLRGLLLVLASSVAMGQSPPSWVKRTQGAEPGRGPGAELREHELRVPPIQLGNRARPAPYQPQELLELVPTGKHSEAGFRQLSNKRTGAICTLLIGPVSPSFDFGVLVNPSTVPHDPIVRNDLSACTK
jgi:hypothetical protein